MKALTFLAAAAVALLAPSTGVAQTQLPVGQAHGVKVVRQHGAIVIVFTAKAERLHRRLAGKKVIVSCTTLGKEGSNTGSQVMRVPVRGRKLSTGDLTRNIDYCRLWRPRTKHERKRIIVSIPLTQKGAVHIDEETKARAMASLLGLASLVSAQKHLDGYPTYDQLVAAVPKRARAAFSKRVVPLAAPTAVPPARTVGYYSDGGEQLALAVVSRSGRLLFIRFAPDDVFSTNVLGYIFSEPE